MRVRYGGSQAERESSGQSASTASSATAATAAGKKPAKAPGSSTRPEQNGSKKGKAVENGGKLAGGAGEGGGGEAKAEKKKKDKGKGPKPAAAGENGGVAAAATEDAATAIEQAPSVAQS